MEIITKNKTDTTITHDIISINESPTELIAETILLSEIGSIIAAVSLYIEIGRATRLNSSHI